MKKTLEQRFWGKVRVSAPDECWEWTHSVHPNGYGMFGENGKCSKAHRVSWRISNGEIPEGLSILHKCDNRKCVNPNHLFLGTPKDNAKDMADKGRHASQNRKDGTRQKVSWIGRIKIKASTLPTVDLANQFGVSESAITRIRYGRVGSKQSSRVRQMTESVVLWISKLIPDDKRDSFNTAIKLQEEISELMHALHTGDGSVKEELADCLILLLDIAYLNGVDIDKELENKLDINRKREWVTKNGSAKHTKDK